MKMLKNTTLSDISLKYLGKTIAAESSIILERDDYKILSQNKALTEITTYINNGNIVVNDGNNDLPSNEGLDYLKYPSYASNIRFLSEPEKSNGMSAKTVQSALEENRNSVVGSIFPLSFSELGVASNEWLEYESDGKNSNESPAVIPFNCELVSMTLTNENQGADSNIVIHKAAKDSGNANIGILTIQLENWRTASLSDFGETPITFNQGDKIGVYLEDQGNNASNVTVLLYFKVLQENKQNQIENWSGNFSGGGGLLGITIDVNI